MKITLKLFANLREYLPHCEGNKCQLELFENTSLEDMLVKLNIPMDLPKIIFVNGVHKDFNYILKENDEVSVFPPIAGG